MDKIKIVSVVSNFDVYKTSIQDNKAMNIHQLISYDNREENIGIPKRYNHFIDENKDDCWIIFCHQDFGFNKNPQEILNKLDKNFIYGPVGVMPKKQFLSIIRLKPKFNVIKNKLIGQINQFKKETQKFKKKGCMVASSTVVETLDCCCLIIHSSLLKKHNLKFDEQLSWHLYSEEFSINAKNKHNVLSKVVQFDCFHIGQGDINEDFDTSWDYVLKKHNLKKVIGTCAPAGKV